MKIDLDSDDDIDIVWMGYTFENGETTLKTTLMANDGSGLFSIIDNLPTINPTDINFVDNDGDNDQDLIIGGRLEGSNSQF